MLTAIVASAVVGVAVSASLVGYGLPKAGSWILGVGVFGFGIACAGITLLTAQLTSSARATYGLTGAVLGISYALRAIGDVSGGALSWLSPIGWYQAMHAYSGDRWWPVLLLLALGLLGALAAYAVFDRRDLGAGVWATRVGPDRASPRLQSGFGLAWRLQRTSVLWWSVGMLLGGLAYGSMGDDVKTIMGDSQASKDIFAAGGGHDILDSFYAVATLMLVLIAAGFTVSSALRPHSEEEAGRVEVLLATGLSRRRWYLGYALVTVLGSLVVALAAGVGIGLGYTLVTGDQSAIPRLTGATFSQISGVFVLGALARLLYGVASRWAVLSWLGLVFCYVVVMFGTLLDFPQWVIDLSPFSHLAAVPAVPMSWGPFAVVLAVAVAMSAGGLVAFRRRDVR
jgi:ABC-2 type transport system permease protein